MKKLTKSATRRFAMCPKCLEFHPLTMHHVKPKRFYGNNIFRVRICRKCHDFLEDIIRKLELGRGGRLKGIEYVEIVRKFLKGGCDEGDL